MARGHISRDILHGEGSSETWFRIMSGTKGDAPLAPVGHGANPVHVAAASK